MAVVGPLIIESVAVVVVLSVGGVSGPRADTGTVFTGVLGLVVCVGLSAVWAYAVARRARERAADLERESE